MNLDIPIPPQCRARALKLLLDAGFVDVSEDLIAGTPARAVAWKLGGLSPRRRHTILELIELSDDSDEAA